MGYKSQERMSVYAHMADGDTVQAIKLAEEDKKAAPDQTGDFNPVNAGHTNLEEFPVNQQVYDVEMVGHTFNLDNFGHGNDKSAQNLKNKSICPSQKQSRKMCNITI